MSHQEGVGRQELPEPVGRIGVKGLLAMFVLAILVGVSLAAHFVQEQRGLIVTGMRTPGLGGAAWGLHICMYIYFVGVSFAGISIAAMVRLMNITVLRPLTRIAELLTVVTLLVSALFVMSDLGRPDVGLLNLPEFARPLSPFFGTFTLVVSGYLFASLVFFFLSGRPDAYRAQQVGPRLLRPWYWLWASGYRDTTAERQRHSRTSFWLALFILPLLVIAHSTLGFIFGIQGGRPGWFSALQAPGFVVLAGCSGIGALIVVAAILRRGLHLEDVITDAAFRLLGNLMWILTMIYLYFMLVEELTANYAAARAESELAHHIVFGHFAPLFWSTVGLMLTTLVIGIVQYVSGRTRVGWLVVAGLTINAGAILKRILIVVPSQTHGTLLPYDQPQAGYFPSLQEIAVVVGLAALGALLYVLFVYSFPIVPSRHVSRGGPRNPAPEKNRRLRHVAFFATLVLGLSLALIGFLLSARLGTLPYSDPILPFSPVIFIIGVMLTFTSAAVYEIFPREPLPGGSDEAPGSA